MASVCVALHCTPSDYWAMTLAERDAIVSTLNAARRR